MKVFQTDAGSLRVKIALYYGLMILATENSERERE
jgi:hypothetical protein